MNDAIYMVINTLTDNTAPNISEAEALELIQNVADEIETFSILSPEDSAKIRLIKRLDNLQNDINIGIPNKNANLGLVIENGHLAFVSKCAITSRNILIISEYKY